MHGTFDEPPIIIRQRRGKLIFMFGLWLAFVTGLLLAVTYPNLFFVVFQSDPAKSIAGLLLYAALFVFTSLAAVAAFSVVSPAKLILEPRGITWRYLRGTRHLSWDDVDQFDVGSASAHSHRKAVFYNLSQRYLWEHPHQEFPLGHCGTSWEKGARELADLLNSAKAKWGEDRTPRMPDEYPKQTDLVRRVA